MASEDNKEQDMNEGRHSKISSRSSSPDLFKLLDISWPWDSAPRFYALQAYDINKNSEETESTTSSGDSDTSEDDLSFLEDTTSDSNSALQNDGVEAETEATGSTIMFSHTSLSVLEDTSGQQIPGTQDAEVPKSIIISGELKDLDRQSHERAHDAIEFLDSPQNEKNEYETGNEITLEESQPISSKPQEVAIASKKKQRRGWKGVRRQISHLCSSLFCCFLTPKTGDTTPR
ncbi:hypothetical protein HispidOSU_022697 [Sigmodon hispidus]